MVIQNKKGHPEIKGLIILVSALFLFLSLLSFLHGHPHENWFGLVGYCLSLSLLYVFGLGAYLLIGWIGWIGWKMLTTKPPYEFGIQTLYFSLFLFSCCILMNLFIETQTLNFPLINQRIYSEMYLTGAPFPHRIIRFNLGGVPFYYLYLDLPTFNLENLLSNAGVCMTFAITALISFILLTHMRIIPFLQKSRSCIKATYHFLLKVLKDLKPATYQTQTNIDSYSHLERFLQNKPLPKPETPYVSPPSPQESHTPETPRYLVKTHLDHHPLKNTSPPRTFLSHDSKKLKRYQLPSAQLLTTIKKMDQPTLKKDLQKQASMLEDTLLSFGIKARVGQINCGPTITSFEVHPPVGVKVQKIKVLENDIALNLQAKSIRIIAPIPGKAAVGVEIPSLYPQEVSFKDMLNDYYKKGKKLHIPIFLGQTVTGDNVTADLTKMPHCIIAGATGSGKSVCINTIVMSILMTARPDEIRLLLIDPKKVELTAYTRLPHMIAPVITEAHGAYAALNWLVKEMQHRYEILKYLHLRNIHAFNHRRIHSAQEQALPIEIPHKMPYFVAIIDEFADLMMMSSSDLETPIARIAQMARAVGIHLILATQRPSREVITGLIKANFPTRIGFKVSSRMNSQIIFDENGAEGLVGNGDLLFMPPGGAHLIRAQGAYIRDEDINRVIDFIEKQNSPHYLIKSFDQLSDDVGGGKEEPKDDLYHQAYNIVINTQTASTTYLQRKLNIGYPRAAALIDELEKRKVIGPQEGSRPRQVYISLDKKE